jgi:hypothetical protein
MAGLLPSRIEPLDDNAQHGADPRRERPPQPKADVIPSPALPPLDPEPDQDAPHQLDELA